MKPAPAAPDGAFGGDIGKRGDFIHPVCAALSSPAPSDQISGRSVRTRLIAALASPAGIYISAYMKSAEIGLGSLLRAVIASLDDGVQELYRSEGESFRPRYFPVVRLLLKRDSMRVGELAEACGVSQPAMTQTLAAMRDDGIVRSTDGTDQRARLVSLTPNGRTQAARLERLWTATARAASQLETECNISLAAIAGDYLAALDRKPFIDRIKEQL